MTKNSKKRSVHLCHTISNLSESQYRELIESRRRVKLSEEFRIQPGSFIDYSIDSNLRISSL